MAAYINENKIVFVIIDLEINIFIEKQHNAQRTIFNFDIEVSGTSRLLKNYLVNFKCWYTVIKNAYTVPSLFNELHVSTQNRYL